MSKLNHSTANLSKGTKGNKGATGGNIMNIASLEMGPLWEKYGKQILISVLAILLAFGGLQYYRYYQSTQSEKASVIYDNLLTLVKSRDASKAKVEAGILAKQYARTPYGPLAALLLAKYNVEENKLDDAQANLKLAMQLETQGPVHQIARVRLARILASRENYKEALGLLSSKKVPEGYVTLFEEAKGDIYLLQNEKDKAREAYKAAQLAAPAGAPVVRLQLKQADLGT